MNAIEQCVINNNGDPSNLLNLMTPSPDNIGYSTIVSGIQSGHEVLKLINSVYEWQSEPLMYMVDGSKSITHPPDLRKLRRILAMRGDTPYLGIACPEKLDIYKISLDEKELSEVKVKFDSSAKEEGAVFAKLANLRPDPKESQSVAVSEVILKLLTTSIKNLSNLKELSDYDIISLVGRALFARFLADRDLIPNHLTKTNDCSDLFDNAKKTLATSNWIDETFNGDFLPITDSVIRKLSPESCHELGNIMRKAENDMLYLGWNDKIWNFLDFAHIPVGILSQVYEMYLNTLHPLQQKEQSGYYTPSTIASFMSEISIGATLFEAKVKKPRILDPAAGAGVFLITAFQLLVRDRWKKDKKRPDTKTLRSILNNQITGFEIDETALRFAALGLYLISIELDANPNPITNQKFDNLIDNVLFNFAGDKTNGQSDLGSLNISDKDKHRGQYDIVIGNPPWSSGKKSSDWPNVKKSIKHMMNDRGFKCQFNPIPYNSSDLAFLWKTMEWVKPDGQIALILDARFLYQHGAKMPEVRNLLFDSLKVSIIINGTDLIKTKVMPNTKAPFCILFAKNQIPPPNSEFRFITPRFNYTLNREGKFNIDTKNSVYVSSNVHKENLNVLKILSKGSTLDYSTYSKIKSMNYPTLKSIWSNPNVKSLPELKLSHGNGFKKILNQNDSKTNSPVNLALDKNIPILPKDYSGPILIDHNLCDPPIELHRFKDVRDDKIYQGPLLIVHQSPTKEKRRFNTFVSTKSLRYNYSHYGYSACGHPNGEQLVKYLCLIIKSNITIWQILMISGKFGVERESIQMIELDNLMIPDFNNLSKSQLLIVDKYFENLNSNQLRDSTLDDWVAELYGFK